MSEENIRPTSSKEAPAAETAAQTSGTASSLTELDKSMADDLIQATVEDVMRQGGFTRALRGESQIVGEGGIVDALRYQEAKGRELAQGLIDMRGSDLRVMTISASEFAKLSDKTAQILHDAALAYERIGKDQQEIEQLKTETRATLARLRAA